MAWKEVEMSGDVINLEINQNIEGKYIEKQETQYGYVYKIETPNGAKAIYSKTILQSKMDLVPINSFVRITRLDDQKTGQGRIAQSFKVEVADNT